MFTGAMRVTVPNFVVIGRTVARRFNGFQDGGRRPSWSCFAGVWTTREEYLVVFNAVQNLIGMEAVLKQEIK